MSSANSGPRSDQAFMSEALTIDTKQEEQSPETTSITSIPDNPDTCCANLPEDLEDAETDNLARTHSNGSFGSTYEVEDFTTFKGKVIQLSQDLGYGTPLLVEELGDLSYNRIIALEFASGVYKKMILRIPLSHWGKREAARLKDQAAVLGFLRKFEFLHVPKLLSVDLTDNNAIGIFYYLMERCPGSTPQSVYYDLPLAEKLKVAAAIAKLTHQMESLAVDGNGCLIYPTSKENGQQMEDGIEITGYKFAPCKFMSRLEKQPLASLLINALEQWKSHDPDWKESLYEQLQQIVREMEEVGLMRVTDNDSVIWHWDFSPNNVLILPPTAENEEWTIGGVIDWDEALSVPLVLSRGPPIWLWYNDDSQGTWSGIRDDIPDDRILGPEELCIKGHFDQLMQRYSPTYIEDAYHRGPWLRGLARFAIYAFDSAESGEAYGRLETFSEKWKQYYDSVVKPGNEKDSDDEDSSVDESSTANGGDESDEADEGAGEDGSIDEVAAVDKGGDQENVEGEVEPEAV